MKKIYLLLISLMFAGVGFGQTIISNPTFTGGATVNPPAGYEVTQVSFPVGYALFQNNDVSQLRSNQNLNTSAYGIVTVAFQVSKVEPGNATEITAQYSIDNGLSWQFGASTLIDSNGAGFVSNSFDVINPGSILRVRFTKTGTGNKNAGLRNLVITGKCNVPTTQASNFTVTNLNSPSIGNATLNWTRGNGTNVLVVLRANGAVNADPQSGTSYTANPAFGTPATQLGTGNYVVYNGPSTTATVNVSNLATNTTYHVAIYEYNSSGNCYKTPALTGNFTVPCPATANPVAFTATAFSLSQINLAYTANAANNNTVIVFNTVNTFGTPTGSPPAVGGTFTGGGTVLFNASGNGTYNHTGLNPNTTYYYRAYSYNGCSYSSGLSEQATTLCKPTAQATNFTATNINSPFIGNATLNWTRGNGTNVLVVLRANGAVNADPQDGTSYSANPAFGLGQQIGTGNYVVYNGLSTTSTVNVSNLLLGTTYHVAIYEYNSTGTCYLTPPLKDSFTVTVGKTYEFVLTSWLPPNGDPNGVSTAADNISIGYGSAVIYTNTLIGNVTINESGALTVNFGSTLTVNVALEMASTNLQYSSLIVEGTVIGTVKYDRHVNGGTEVIGHIGAGANDLISSPVNSTELFGVFAAANANIKFDKRPEPIGNPNNKLFGPFDKATGTYLLWNAVTDGNKAIIPGVGYRTASNDNLGFTFTGTVNQGIVTNDIQYSGPQFVKWNLVGNPYPSYINVGQFLNYLLYDDPGTDPALDVRNIDLLASASAAIYGYDGDASDGYTIYNLNNSDDNMAPGQGFLVPAKQSLVLPYDLTFAPSMRVIANNDDFILGRSANTNNFHVRLQASIGNDAYRTDFYFNDNSTSGLDVGYDASVYNNQAAANSIYSRLVENSVGIDMAIQSLAINALESEITVPLGVNVNAGKQVTVSISESDLASNIEVYLEDTITGTFTLLNSSAYTFTPTSNLNSPGRFFLRFSQSTLSSPELLESGLQIYTTTTSRTLFVKGQLEAATTIALYDTLGRKVLSSNLEAGTSANNVDVSSLNAGVYIVKLNNTTQQKTQKIIIK